MQAISNKQELRLAIERQQTLIHQKESALKENGVAFYNSLKPGAILKSVMQNITDTPEIKKNLPGTIAGIVLGYLSNKVVAGKNSGVVRNIAGTLVQFGITNFIAKRFPMFRNRN